MEEHRPIGLDTSPHDLTALKSGIRGWAANTQVEGRMTSAAWLFTAAGPYIITVASFDVVFKFEVFPLSIQTPATVLSRLKEFEPQRNEIVRQMREAGIELPVPETPTELPPPEPIAWPFTRWKLEVVSRLDWIADPAVDQMPPAGEPFGENLQPGELPPGTQHSCLVALGLLFTDEGGRRLLFAADDFPLNLLVTSEASEIDAYLGPCFVDSVDDYFERFR